jgi:hypothetical protein
MLQSAHPGHKTFYAHAEPAVRNRAESPQIQIPFERLPRKFVLVEPLFKER